MSRNDNRTSVRFETDRNRMRHFGLPAAYFDASLDGVADADARQFLAEYVSHDGSMYRAGQGIIFSGHPLCGKSSAAAVLMKFFLGKGIDVRFVAASRMQEVIAAHEVTNDERPWEDVWKRISVLVVDDFGSERLPGSYQRNFVVEVIRHRLEERKVSILTTNLSKKIFQERYPEDFCVRLENLFHRVVMVKKYPVVKLSVVGKEL